MTGQTVSHYQMVEKLGGGGHATNGTCRVSAALRFASSSERSWLPAHLGEADRQGTQGVRGPGEGADTPGRSGQRRTERRLVVPRASANPLPEKFFGRRTPRQMAPDETLSVRGFGVQRWTPSTKPCPSLDAVFRLSARASPSPPAWAFGLT